MSTLYEINAQIEELERSMVDPETGEISEDCLDALDEIQMEKKEKVDNIACLIKSLEAEAESIEDEAKNLKARAGVKKNKAKHLRDYLAHNCAGEVYGTNRSKVWWKPSSRVEVSEDWEKVLPDEYIRCSTVTAPDKAGLKKALGNGEKIKGAELIEHQNLQIG